MTDTAESAAPRLLVAAEDPLGRGGLAALLTAAGARVVGAVAPAAARGSAASVAADAVVWDVGAGRAALPDGGIPTVALVVDPAAARAALAHGARAVLARDLDGPRIRRAVAAVLDGLVVIDEPFAASLLRDAEPDDDDDDALTAREAEVLALVARGQSNAEIGEDLGISAHTAKFHVRALMEKLGAKSRTDAVVRAARRGRLTF